MVDPVLDEIVSRLATHFQPRQIHLFGSRVRGAAAPTSDYDILVVVGKLEEPAYRYSQKAHEVLWGLKCSKDIFFTTSERFEELRTSVGSLSELVHRNGKQLFPPPA